MKKTELPPVSRNRIPVSLTEDNYEYLKARIEALEKENNRLKTLIER